MSVASDPSFSTTETLINSLRRDIGEISERAIEMTRFAQEAQATLWEIERRRTQAPAREGEGPLLGAKTLPVEGCYCRGTCGAPSIMGRQMPCIRNPDYPLSRQHQEGEGRE